MSAKFMFDENMPIKVVRALKDAIANIDPLVVVEYLPAYMRGFQSNDREWVPALAQSGWVVVTADRGKSNRRVKLPRICREFKVTHVLVGSSVHNLSIADKVAVFLRAWDRLLATALSEPGTRFRLMLRGDRILLEEDRSL